MLSYIPRADLVRRNTLDGTSIMGSSMYIPQLAKLRTRAISHLFHSPSDERSVVEPSYLAGAE
jgi:hypothetical protein